jgi:phospholipid-binding lipoprotein MlaA
MAMFRRLSALALILAALSGCATATNPADPLEGFNRAMFKFNDKVDDYVMKPVSKGYEAAVPSLVRTGVTNFFSNLQDLWISANNLLQGKVEWAMGDFLRFTFNSSFGIFGVFDVASDMGLDKHDEDFGQTLGRWGIGSGPYLVLPFLGPSTVRDGLGFVADFKADPVGHIDDVPVRNSLYGVRFVNTRTNLLDATNILEQAALDKYTFVRDSWLQRRRSLVYDGNPPKLPDPDSDDDAPKSDTGAPKPDSNAPKPDGNAPKSDPGERKSDAGGPPGRAEAVAWLVPPPAVAFLAIPTSSEPRSCPVHANVAVGVISVYVYAEHTALGTEP